MVSRKECEVILSRLKTDRDDLRHTVLEVSAKFMAVAESVQSDSSSLNEGLKRELSEIIAEVRAVQPRFPSHRKTSLLFDREGMGIPGHDRARRTAMRMISVLKTIIPAK